VGTRVICDIPSFLPPDTRKTPSRAASTGAPRVVIAPTRLENGFFRFHANPADVSYPRRPTQSTGPEVPQVRSGQENHVVRVPHRFPRVAFLPHRTRAWPPTQHNTHALDSTIVSVTSFSRSADVFFSVFFFSSRTHRRTAVHPLSTYIALLIPTNPYQSLPPPNKQKQQAQTRGRPPWQAVQEIQKGRQGWEGWEEERAREGKGRAGPEQTERPEGCVFFLPRVLSHGLAIVWPVHHPFLRFRTETVMFPCVSRTPACACLIFPD
jgi:hypothetical protein